MNTMSVCRSIATWPAVAACAALLAALVTPASAQDTVERVEITGSSIKRIESEGALPVQVLDRSDIQRSGVQSVTELLQSLPVMQGYTTSSQSVGGGGAGFAGASIHNIGETRTLVLLNGQRLSTWAGQTLTGSGAAIDLNSIPLAAIERIEILTDGASALYGSDAVAGVINFILRSDKTDGDVFFNQMVPKGNVGKQTTLSASKGWGSLATDGHNAMIVYSKDKQDSMKATDRDFAKSGVIRFSHGGKNFVFFNGSSRTAPATYDVFDPTGVERPGFPGNSLVPLANPQGTNCGPNHVLRGRCRFDYTSTIEILPNSERDNLIGTFTKKLSADQTLSASLVYSKFSLTSKIAPPPVDMLIPTGSTLYNTYISAVGGTPGDSLFAYWRGVDAGNRTTDDETTAWNGTLSLKGVFAGWDYSTAFTHSTNYWREKYTAGWLSLNQLNAAIAAGSFDPFLSPGQQSAAGKAAIANMQFRGEYKNETSTLDTLGLKGSREVFKLGNRAALLGAGIDFRRERVEYKPSAIARGIGNSIAGDSASEKAFDVSRNSWGAFAELLTPLTKAFELTTALRHDNYQDFGNAETYKLGARFQPVRTFLVRGSIGTGFRAPSVPQVAAGRQQYGVTGGVYNCPAAGLAAVQLTDPTAVCRVPDSQYDQFASGNSNLKPETSRQVSLGFRFEPTASVSFGLDWWKVDIKDRIDQLAEDVVMRDSSRYRKNFTVFNDPGTGIHYVALYLPNENLGEQKYAGIDLDAKLQTGTPIGMLTTTLHWTHMLKNEYQREPGGAFFTNLGAYNDDEVTFRNIGRLRFSLATGNWQNGLTFNYKSGYKDYQCSAADCSLVRTVNPDGTVGGLVDMMDHNVDAYKTLDWQTQYLYSKALSLTAGILNLTDQDPPMTIRVSGPHQLGYDPRYTDPRGRTIYASLNYKF
jgi:iron complex outermembrane receptor protein